MSYRSCTATTTVLWQQQLERVKNFSDYKMNSNQDLYVEMNMTPQVVETSENPTQQSVFPVLGGFFIIPFSLKLTFKTKKIYSLQKIPKYIASSLVL